MMAININMLSLRYVNSDSAYHFVPGYY